MDKKEPDFIDLNQQDSAPSHSPAPPASTPDDWMERVEESRAAERRVLEDLLRDNTREQRRGRWGRNLFRLFIVGYLLFLAWGAHEGSWSGDELDSLATGKGHTAVVDVIGPIMAGSPYSAENIIRGLTEAFEDPDTKGVILRINSPGGSPVQAGQVYDAMIHLRKLFPKMPVYAALEDICASGGYYIAASAPHIYADKASMVGSIGVILQGFGLEKAMEKIGVESRQLTAGSNKSFLDPFSPVNPKESAHAQSLLRRIHAQFIKAVKEGRGDRLKPGNQELFEGLVWTGDQAVTIGLVDGLGSASWIARTLIKSKRMVSYTYKGDWFSRMGLRVDAMVRQALQPSTIGWVLR
ncbi:MAG: S49 family peptidase [Magnetococcales bacterium]|nr:S49 family peptidase [Magnetococcales bacterium]